MVQIIYIQQLKNLQKMQDNHISDDSHEITIENNPNECLEIIKPE